MRAGTQFHALGIYVGMVAGGAGIAAGQQVAFSVNAGAGQTAISSLIYGLNTSISSGNPDNATFIRQGGNRWTAYNYLTNASNAGSDYEYENDNFLGGGNTPAGAVLPFVQNGQANGAGLLLTVPINGYVSNDESGPVNGGKAPTVPPSQSSHFTPEFPTAAQDPAAGTAAAANHVYENGFVQIIKNQMASTPNVPLAFDLDNEPDLWSSTHPEVHPAPVSYAELVQKSVAYATMIKSVDPSALVYGPVSYGWEGYQTLQNAPDSAADGNFLNYYLKNMAAASNAAGVRLLDSMDLHWYPEATGLNASGQSTRITDDDTSAGVVAARLQAPRSLWDPTYVENSYITAPSTGSLGTDGKGINLIPLMQSKIAANDPGTKLSFSEYNYGAGDSISGALAEADVLGIFGKYGVYSANEWPLLSNENFIAGAFKMFRNYDGHDASFGNTEVTASDSDTTDTSLYAAIDSANPGHLTLVMINKESSAVTTSLTLAGGVYLNGSVYQLTAANANPVFAGSVALSNDVLDYTMPGYSVSTLSLYAVPEPVALPAIAAGLLTLRRRGRTSQAHV